MEIRWKLSLASPPSVAFMGIGVHGPARKESYRVERYWCLHLYPYDGEIEVEGITLPIRPGCAGILPPGAQTAYTFRTRCQHACAHFALPEPAGAMLEAPAMQNLGDRFAGIYQAFEEGIACVSTYRPRAEARLWDILWQLCSPAPGDALLQNHWHPALVRAVEVIELKLAERLRVSEIAQEVDLSHNHLTRLFREAFGSTVVGYIQERRLARAQHLLAYTQLPIKAIAAQVGAADTHQFNKLIHRSLGCSPRVARNRSKGSE